MNYPLPKAILFDLDDTVLDFSSSAEGCWKAVCAQVAPECTGVSAGRLFDALNHYRLWFWKDPERHRRGRLNMSAAWQEIAAHALLQVGIQRPILAGRMAEAFGQARNEAIRLFPEASEVLRCLQRLSIKLALITNGESRGQRAKIDRFGLVPFFDYILIEEEFGAGKPDIRVYQHALDRVAEKPVDAWMVGDNLEWDALGPQRLGILGIWRDVDGNGLPASSPGRPDRIIRSLKELIPLGAT